MESIKYWPFIVNEINHGVVVFDVFTYKAIKMCHKRKYFLTKGITTMLSADAKPGPSYTIPTEVCKDISDHSYIQWDV